ncbi:hypothetical protein Mapa_011368 [Marchantia paleacea]|nr:hypothetical protein Mapa_011368 [Marchantia paleacea]
MFDRKILQRSSIFMPVSIPEFLGTRFAQEIGSECLGFWSMCRTLAGLFQWLAC